MTREDAKKILQMFKISYPNSFKNMAKEDVSMFINLWANAFEKIPTSIVFKCVKEIIYNEQREFAPNVGQVRCKIVEQIAPDTEQRAIHAWEEFRKFIRNTSTWATAEEEKPLYNKLDAITRRMYSYYEAKGLAQLDMNTLEYRRSEFIKLYKTLTYKQNEEYMNEGNLIELADGEERFKALGYTSEEVEQLKIPAPTYNTQGLIG